MPSTRLLGRGSYHEAQRISAVLRKETVGGALLLVAAAIALVWANSPWGAAYETLRDTRVGPASLHLDLTLGTWAADGLLAVFFFVAGLELKRELVAGDLRDPRLNSAGGWRGVGVTAAFRARGQDCRPDFPAHRGSVCRIGRTEALCRTGAGTAVRSG